MLVFKNYKSLNKKEVVESIEKYYNKRFMLYICKNYNDLIITNKLNDLLLFQCFIYAIFPDKRVNRCYNNIINHQHYFYDSNIKEVKELFNY